MFHFDYKGVIDNKQLFWHMSNQSNQMHNNNDMNQFHSRI